MSSVTASTGVAVSASTVKASGIPDQAVNTVSPAERRADRVMASGAPHRFDGLVEQFRHGAADLVVGLLYAGRVEIRAHLAEHVLVTRFLEIGLDDVLCIGFGVLAGLAELFG